MFCSKKFSPLRALKHIAVTQDTGTIHVRVTINTYCKNVSENGMYFLYPFI